MHGIKRICEFSGEDSGFEMRGFRRSHIQILPEHRSTFRGVHAELVFAKVKLQQWEAEMAEKARLQIEEDKAA